MGNLSFLGVSLLVFVIPWENSILLPGVGTLSRAIGVGAIIVGVLSVIAWNRPIRVHAFHGILVLFILSGCLSFFWSLDQERTLIRIITYLQLLGMAWLIFQSGNSIKKVQILLAAYVGGAYISLVSTFWNFASAREGGWERYAATGFNPNDMAIILALGIPMAWYLSEKQPRGFLIWIFRFYPLFALFGILLTASRNGILAAVLTLSYPLISCFRPPILKKLIVGLILVIGVVSGLSLIPDRSLARVATFNDSITGGMNYRSNIWQAGLQNFAKSPIFGSGMGTFSPSVERILGDSYAPHNVYLSILVDQGIIGFAIFLLLIGISFRAALGLPLPERRLWLVLLGTWCICAFALNWETRKQTWLILVLVVTHHAAFSASILTKKVETSEFLSRP